MATVTKRRNRWVLDYYDQNSIRRREVFKGSKKDAELLLAKRMQDVDRGDYEPREKHKTFAELAAAYTEAHIDMNIRDSTAKDYKTNLRLHLSPRFDAMRLRAMSPQTVEQWRAQMIEGKVGARTINKCHTLLSAMLRYAMRHRWVSDNVAAAVPKLRIEPIHSDDQPLESNMLTPDEVRRLLDEADDRWRPILHMAVATGLRQGELLGLQWGDIDWQTAQVHVRRQFSKGKFSELKTRHSRRRVGLSGDLLRELKAWKLRCPKPKRGEQTEDARELVFPGDDGRPLNHGILLRSGFYPALRRAKLRHVRFHDLRHTAASLWLHAGVSIKRVQTLLGHSSARITLDVYSHCMPDTDDGAAEKLGALIGGHQMVTKSANADTRSSQVIEKMEAGVGIEPAYTDLQSAA